MNTHLKQLWAAMKLPKNFKKSYKFFCLGLDIRVPQIMDSNAFYSRLLRSSRHFMVQETFRQMKNTVSGKNLLQPADIIFQFFTQEIRHTHIPFAFRCLWVCNHIFAL